MRRAMRGELKTSDGYVRAMNYMELAVRRRQLSFGPLGSSMYRPQLIKHILRAPVDGLL